MDWDSYQTHADAVCTHMIESWDSSHVSESHSPPIPTVLTEETQTWSCLRRVRTSLQRFDEHDIRWTLGNFGNPHLMSLVDNDLFRRTKDTYPVVGKFMSQNFGSFPFLKRNHELIAACLIHNVECLDFLVGFP